MFVFEVYSDASISTLKLLFRLVDEHLTIKSFDLFTSKKNNFDNIKISRFFCAITIFTTIESFFIFKITSLKQTIILFENRVETFIYYLLFYQQNTLFN